MEATNNSSQLKKSKYPVSQTSDGTMPKERSQAEVTAVEL